MRARLRLSTTDGVEIVDPTGDDGKIWLDRSLGFPPKAPKNPTPIAITASTNISDLVQASRIQGMPMITPNLLGHQPQSRDPMAWYWEKRPHLSPSDKAELRGEEFRHQSDEPFNLGLLAYSNSPRGGELVVDVSCSNADPISIKIPVKIVDQDVSLLESLQRLGVDERTQTILLKAWNRTLTQHG
tara:strand:- start:306 stop:863 length:558 start_codon:yes stop_codon:yes gene_type:complete